VPAFADRLIRWLEHDDRGPVHLISASLGGAIAVRVTALRPNLLRSLTLLSPAMPFLDPRRTSEGRMLPFLAVPGAHLFAARYMARFTPEQMATQALHDGFGDPARLCEQRRLEVIEEVRMRFTVAHYPRAYLGTLRGPVGSFVRAYLPGSNSLWRLAARVSVPTLVVGGTADRVIDTRVPAQVARVVPDSRYVMLDGVGHLPQMEVPRLAARAILGFLDDLRVHAG
jgi:pimeloyl-ACP methyl ester carboxylesterase